MRKAEERERRTWRKYRKRNKRTIEEWEGSLERIEFGKQNLKVK